MAEERNFYREYNLTHARGKSLKQPASHQAIALDHLLKWYNIHPKPAGGILVLPTGGGKTFAAIRFLCLTALSDGYKVLWLAHTHHLLEQAFDDFKEHVGKISETKSSLNVRVVSGTKGHFPVHTIKSEDDVVIATLQTITNAYNIDHFALKRFIEAANGKLFVVFDEAHHAPAPSYRQLIQNLRDRCAQMAVLGLTATPVYTDDKLKGWLANLFPQGILYQVTPQELMAQGILAKPITQQQETNITPDFSENEFQKWLGTFRDLPEEIITRLAKDKTRNLFIAEHYANNREKYGKTIIFADRWFQCEAIGKFLSQRGVRTGTIYTHIDADPGSADARNKRKRDENSRILEAFRKGNLDVVLNVRMLTEGTDVPDVNTCFITRQTTSRILLTQMVGRALRGPKFGGTPEAYLVFFTDNWQHLINWAEYEPLTSDVVGPDEREHGKRPPIRYISIELVRKLAAQMDSGININTGPFKTLLPLGWYRVEYVAKWADSEEIETIKRLVMVFDNEEAGYKQLIEHLMGHSPKNFFDEGIQFDKVADTITDWKMRFFSQTEEHFGSDLSQDIFSISRHVAQNGTSPKFFNFDERDRHDLDIVAQEMMDKVLSPIQVDDEIRLVYNLQDRYWQVLYPSYELFKSQYNACVERILHAQRHGLSPKDHKPIFVEPEKIPESPSDDLIRQVKERDGGCLCCWTTNSRVLQVDHIAPKYFGGQNNLDNLQTLCKKCNQQKHINRINFRDSQTDLTMPPGAFPEFEVPKGKQAGSPDEWIYFLCRTINFFYQCGAVHCVYIGSRGKHFYHWQIQLNANNDPRWLEPHIPALFKRICDAKAKAGYGVPNAITVCAPDLPKITYRTKST